MKIIEMRKLFFVIEIYYKKYTTQIEFEPDSKTLIFKYNDFLTEFLKENEYQLRKILHNKRKKTYYVDFTLNFIIKKNRDVVNFNDKSKLIVLDKTNNERNCYTTDKGFEPIIKIYTDGCYLEKYGKSSFVCLIKNIKNKYNLYTSTTNFKNSSLAELQAVIKGLKIVSNTKKVRILTDSRYVIKGLTEWIENWLLNDWHTAQGTKVKNKKYWLEFEKLTNSKYIEFEWVKSHRDHFENNICDYYAKIAAKRHLKSNLI